MKTIDRFKYIELLDIYSPLLTKHQYEILNYYLNEDYSLSEISKIYHISKSAVSDLINRSLKQIKDYDKKLNLYNKFNLIEKNLCKTKKNKVILDKIIRG